MQKVIFSITRFFLVLGVIIALTPCDICKNASMVHSSGMKSCCMMHMDGKQDCCHSKKSQQPFCKAMDQSSVVPALHGTVLAVKPFAVAAVVETMLSVQVCAIPSFSAVSSSPPRGTLALRI
jgi:hypothetical protein